MAKIIIELRTVGRQGTWKEEYDSSNLIDPDDMRRRPRAKNFRCEVDHEEAGRQWAEDLIWAFNATQPEGSLKRELVEFEWIE